MKLFLQFGYGMKGLTLDLARKWGGLSTSVILSPRDMGPGQLRAWSRDFEKANVQCYFDPQCYCPKQRSGKLPEYSYWNSHFGTVVDSTGLRIEGQIDDQIKKIKGCNDIANTKAYILPSILQDYTDAWEYQYIARSQKIIESAQMNMQDKPIYATLALPKNFLLQRGDHIETFLEKICSWNADGFYLIAEAPEKKYLVDNPIWLSNILHICATLKLNGKKIIYGYGNHQLLLLSLVKVDALASGTWLNVRSFTNRFVGGNEQKRKSTWIYYPEALSEYKFSFLDMAGAMGVLSSMRPKDEDCLDEQTKILFDGNVPPSQTGVGETDAFRLYLCCLKHQVELLDKSSFKETLLAYQMILTTAEREIERLEGNGVFAQTRSFKDFIDVNRSAITLLQRDQGFALKHSWNQL